MHGIFEHDDHHWDGRVFRSYHRDFCRRLSFDNMVEVPGRPNFGRLDRTAKGSLEEINFISSFFALICQPARFRCCCCQNFLAEHLLPPLCVCRFLLQEPEQLLSALLPPLAQ
jgi:hypothetical protein